jgi:hypothetical protein
MKKQMVSRGLGATPQRVGPALPYYILLSQILTVSLTRTSQESIRGSCLKKKKFTCRFGYFLPSKANILEEIKAFTMTFNPVQMPSYH